MSGGRRSLANLTGTTQGSAFHELIVVPTLIPELARPFINPGSDAPPLGRARASSHTAETETQSDATSEPPSNSDEHVNDARLLYVHVTLEWSERPTLARSRARPKKQHESKLVPRAVDVLTTSRVAFIPIALGAHGYGDTYMAGIASGPAMRISWSGSAGGKTGAAVVLFDTDWKIIIDKLRSALTASRKLDTICVIFDLDTMEGFKTRPKRIHSPDFYEPELSFGTHVPNTEHCTPAQLALGSAIDEIKAAHSCAEHGTCFINADLQHLEMNRFRLQMWGQAVVSGKSAASDPPPKELLVTWTGAGAVVASTLKPRGRSGPFPAQQFPIASTSTSDTANLLLTTMVPVMAMMAQNMVGNFPRTPAPAPNGPPALPRSPVAASSPPPAIEDDLDVFMDAFRRAKKIPDEVINNAKVQLRDGRYTPDILCEPSVTLERLTELTGLAEGEVHQLKKFAREWSGKIEGKRARRGIQF
ncbi:hypothetical protein GGX14DRAFT_395234 [Mycena pura]|uniref:Uncharacterized protein n=1 Tax=Mycena pura TaxID=153505 RepID=A0AAD6YCH9_9AGAR|nr:hypothetical protein GGX14DRAFT_395234 [Mycena pura]